MSAADRLDPSERKAWLRLARTRNVGPVTFAQLIKQFGSASHAIAEVPRLAAHGGGMLSLASKDSIARELDLLGKFGGRMIASIESEFPAALDPPPPCIFVTGTVSALDREMIAIVGTRNASALGRKLSTDLAHGLSEQGLVVVSGLARGIDAAAHNGALEYGTLAVLAGGIDVVYPPENRSLYDAIREYGVILSEMPLGLQPQARHFPRRNRLISGLARGVVVVEASKGSGSLIAARYALEQGREIFAVPGSPLDPRAAGTNGLIRDGATLTENVEDILSVLRPIIGDRSPQSEPDVSVPGTVRT